MTYTIKLDLEIDSDEIFTDQQILDFLKTQLSCASITVSDLNVLDVND